MSKGMRKYSKKGKEIFGMASNAFGLGYLSVATMNDDEFLQVQGFRPVSQQRHLEEFWSEISELQEQV